MDIDSDYLDRDLTNKPVKVSKIIPQLSTGLKESEHQEDAWIGR